MDEETDSMLLSLIKKEIPEGRMALTDSHKNLSALSDYCRNNYFNRYVGKVFSDICNIYKFTATKILLPLVLHVNLLTNNGKSAE